MIRRNVVEQHGGYDERLKALADYDFWLNLLRKGVRIANLAEPLYVFYEHGNSIRSDVDLTHNHLIRIIEKWEGGVCRARDERNV